MSNTRTRVIYQSEALFVGPTPCSGAHYSSGNSGANSINQLYRIQSSNYNFNIPRLDVGQWGQLDPISQEIVEPPTVNLDFSYLVTNALNENRMGFVTDGSASIVSGFITKQTDDKNYFIVTAPEGIDFNTSSLSSDQYDVIGIGNGFISSYSTQGAVGGLPSASVAVAASNIKFYTGSSGFGIPAINPVDGSDITGYTFQIPAGASGVAGQVSILRPGDITLNLGNSILGVNVSNAKIQSYNISCNLNRQELRQLGNEFPYSREIQFPVAATMTVEAELGQLTTGSLSSVFCNDIPYDLSVILRKPSCTGNNATGVVYTLKGAKLDGVNFTSSIGPSKRVSATFSTRLSAQNTAKGFFISGSLV